MQIVFNKEYYSIDLRGKYTLGTFNQNSLLKTNTHSCKVDTMKGKSARSFHVLHSSGLK